MSHCEKSTVFAVTGWLAGATGRNWILPCSCPWSLVLFWFFFFFVFR